MKRLIFKAKALVDVEHILLFLADWHAELPLRFRIALQDHLSERMNFFATTLLSTSTRGYSCSTKRPDSSGKPPTSG